MVAMENKADTRPIITAYCLEWHITTSGSMHDLLINPLAPYADIRQVAWNGLDELPAPKAGEKIIFYMMPPTEAWMEKYPVPVIWIPMADAINHLPKIKYHAGVKIVSFSRAVEEMAKDLGLAYLSVRYFSNPDHFPQASFDDGRVMLYWNRTGFFHDRLIKTICRKLKIKRLIFRSAIDPGIKPEKYYALPPKIHHTVVETHETLTSFQDYLHLLGRANVFIAPRAIEGVGVVFLEAMASGCVVIGYDEVAMNEYITHGETGFLFGAVQPRYRWLWSEKGILYRAINKLSWKIRKRGYRLQPHMTTFQDWRFIQKQDFAKIGNQARAAMAEGYAKWIANIPVYADFVIQNEDK